MILTILLLVLIAIGVVLAIVGGVIDEEVPLTIGVILVIVSLIPAVLGVCFGIDANVNADINRQKALDERAAIVRRVELQEMAIDENGSLVVNGGLYDDIIEFNDKVRKDNRWGTNPWTNWYRGWEYAGLEEIPVPGGR